MERKIDWVTGCFDEIELVYDKAEKNVDIAHILTQLEIGALAEARLHCGMYQVEGRPLTPAEYDGLPDHAKENLMAALSNVGLGFFDASLKEPKITVRLTKNIQMVRCCTAFSILNRLEKLDGAYNVRFPKATLVIQAPLGGKKGLFQIEMLIMLLYPWLTVTEVSTDEEAVEPPQTRTAPKPAEPKPPVQTNPAPPVPSEPAPRPVEKPRNKGSLLGKLFGRKKEAEHTPVGSGPAGASLYCRRCGVRLLPDSLFCSKCGTKVE